jgi:A/G-specific adenine glycosylase
LDSTALQKKLAEWYTRNRRDLPWRRTRDPFAIWISEIMLQQTRVAAAIPYYERFLARFPDALSLARASEDEVLALWSGLGYYSRARNLRRAAALIVDQGSFPSDYAAIRELPGIGDYTAAAVASIAYGLPHAVVDGNVRRVVARLTNDADADVQQVADGLLGRKDPGSSNQALMELGALICLPRAPLCGVCPVARQCEAHKHGAQEDLPPKRPRPAPERIARTLLVIRRRGKILLTPSARVRGFWDLPEPFAGARMGRAIGAFRHTILNRRYSFEVREAFATTVPADSRWWTSAEIPLSTTTKKALLLLSGKRQTAKIDRLPHPMA